jgi:uncharacterized membrane protein
VAHDDDEPPDSLASRAPGARRLLDPRAATGRLLISAAVGIVSTVLTPSGEVPLRVRAVVGWDAGALLFAALSWVMISRASAAETKKRAALEDPGRRLVFVIALASSLFSLFAAVVVMRQVRTLAPGHVQIWTGLALAAVALSWVVTHTAFTLRYAHLYYRRHATKQCFEFPRTEAPSDVDFAYFAFTIGMSFQVSDVVVASCHARRAVLIHALISFVYNTTILALTLNLVTAAVG